MILNRISQIVEQRLIKEQAGFMTGKSCSSQLLNLTQHIEDGYQRGMITGAVFVDLSVSYDTMNHIILIQKLYNITQESPLCSVIQNMLSSRKFYVELNNERSRWRKQKNGLPQGSLLTPILFNIYTNDQHLHNRTRFQRQQPTSGGTVRSSDLQIVVNSSFQTVSSTVFRTRVSLQRLS